MALYQQKLRFCWAGLVSTTSFESGIMRRPIIPGLEELFIQREAHQFPQLISSIWRNSSPQVVHVHLPGPFYWETAKFPQIFQEKLIWINTLRSACHIHQTLGVFLDSLEPRVSSSKDISDPGYALLFSTPKAWWKLSVLIMTLEGYWEIFLSNSMLKGGT